MTNISSAPQITPAEMQNPKTSPTAFTPPERLAQTRETAHPATNAKKPTALSRMSERKIAAAVVTITVASANSNFSLPQLSMGIL